MAAMAPPNALLALASHAVRGTIATTRRLPCRCRRHVVAPWCHGAVPSMAMETQQWRNLPWQCLPSGNLLHSY